MKYLYKYPQAEFPYQKLVETNQHRSREEMEYELIDTGIFDEDRYFDIFLEYAKEGPDDILIQVTVHNRGPEAARLHLLPTLWFRNTWSWKEGQPKPSLHEDEGSDPCLAPGAGRLHTLLRWHAGATFHGERKQCPASVGSAKRFSLGQRRLPPVCRFRKRGGRQPGEDRHEGRGSLHPRCARRRFARPSACGLSAAPQASTVRRRL